MIVILYVLGFCMVLFGAYSGAILLGLNGWFGVVAIPIILVGGVVHMKKFGYDHILGLLDIFLTSLMIYGIICLF